MDSFNCITVGITSRCNAICKFCSHNEPYRFDKGILDLDLDVILRPLLHKTNEIVMCGGLGDPILHPNFIKFIRSCRIDFPNLKIIISTNGSITNEYFWLELGILSNNKIKIIFGIDGLEHNHYKYRGTDFNKIIENLKKYVSSGGNAIWQFIVFDYNYNDIEDAANLAKELGCIEFLAIRSDMYDDEFRAPKDILSRNQIMKNLKTNKIFCYWKERKSFYINEYGEVHPCCHILPYLNLNMYDDVREMYLKHKDSISLYKYDIDSIMNTPYIQYIYNNQLNIYRCRSTCRVNENLSPLIKKIKHYKFFDKIENGVT